MFGLIILIIGILFLLKNLGLISGSVWNIFWPLLITAIGLGLMLKKRHSPWEKMHKFGEEMHRKFHEKEE